TGSTITTPGGHNCMVDAKIDGARRSFAKNPAYRPATGKPCICGVFLFQSADIVEWRTSARSATVPSRVLSVPKGLVALVGARLWVRAPAAMPTRSLGHG